MICLCNKLKILLIKVAIVIMLVILVKEWDDLLDGDIG